LLIAEIALLTDMAKRETDNSLYVKCCADWFVCLSVFSFIAFVYFLFAKFIHLCCVIIYDGEIKLYIKIRCRQSSHDLRETERLI